MAGPNKYDFDPLFSEFARIIDDVLDKLGIEHEGSKHWTGLQQFARFEIQLAGDRKLTWRLEPASLIFPDVSQKMPGDLVNDYDLFFGTATAKKVDSRTESAAAVLAGATESQRHAEIKRAVRDILNLDV